jgi:hypothetical protein
LVGIGPFRFSPTATVSATVSHRAIGRLTSFSGDSITFSIVASSEDLLYIHDVLSSGDAVITRVAADARRMGSNDTLADMMIRKAASQMKLH